MDRNKKIIIKEQELNENNNLVMARELVDLDEKISSIKDDINSKNNDDIVDQIKETGQDIVNNFPKPEKMEEFPKEISINNLPEVQNVKVLNFPEQKAPVVNVEAPIVKVESKEYNLDTGNIEQGIKESNTLLKDISKKLEKDEIIEEKGIEKVTLVDEDGKPIRSLGGGGGGVAKYVYNAQGKTINPATEEKQDELISKQDEIITSLEKTYTIRLAESGNYTYVGEAIIGSDEADNVWRIKRIDETSGMVILFAGTGVFDQVWDDYLTLTYS